jgi:hypothetical protein
MKSFNKLFLQLLEIVTDKERSLYKERSNILTAVKTAEIMERDGSVVTGFVVTDKYGNVGIIDKGAVKWIDKAKFYGMMQGGQQPLG